MRLSSIIIISFLAVLQSCNQKVDFYTLTNADVKIENGIILELSSEVAQKK